MVEVVVVVEETSCTAVRCSWWSTASLSLSLPGSGEGAERAKDVR